MPLFTIMHACSLDLKCMEVYSIKLSDLELNTPAYKHFSSCKWNLNKLILSFRIDCEKKGKSLALRPIFIYFYSSF